ncbi:MAG: DNA mismatch repair protein MutS [Bacteroidetes bacterium]|nr:MAG: DNA mismatch repair protein MutS [Bacteroidota bacterium]
MAKAAQETPLMQQHRTIKQKYPDAILLFRVGDFYETFGNDAVLASRILGITLTKRNNGNADSSELAGFPHHALDTYLHKLVKAGYRVAICDQLEDPKQAKGIVKRGVTELLTPGLATNDKLLEQHSNNFLAALHFTELQVGIALVDISTGEFFVAEGKEEYIDKLLQSLQPAEVIFARKHQKHCKQWLGSKVFTYHLDEWIFDTHYATELLTTQFESYSLKGFGVQEMPLGIVAAGAILHYLKDTEHPNLQHITSLQRIEQDEYMWLDKFTIRNLELYPQHEQHHSLLEVLDSTTNAMGARLMKRWLALPLRHPAKIEERLQAVQFFITHSQLQQQLLTALKQCGDVERLISKLPLKKINPREVVALAKSLVAMAQVKQYLLAPDTHSYLVRLAETMVGCETIATKILTELEEAPPLTLQKGSVVRPGVVAELDELRNIAQGGKQYLLDIQQREADGTGISSLKIGFNNVFGYYLEVTNVHKNKVPDTWIRKQTLANAERYITPELKTYEEKILGAEDKILQLETQYFETILLALQDYIAAIQSNAQVIATIDCLLAFAKNAVQYSYVLPTINETGILHIEEGRHPVIERFLPAGEPFIPNTVYLHPAEEQIIILTGPNMSGKSAILRQAALITLMAHMGSFVPASKASIPLTDKIFTRVGASDNLSGGESTFMVEMNETASILNNISANSLILLDEIGRGTSTYDGISIAWSIVEYLHKSAFAPKTLFATHYHELNELENLLPRVRNYHVTNKEVGNKILFLRKLARGGSTHSFGIHVAKMAGMPASLVKRANEILQQLEVKHVNAADNSTDSPQVSSIQSNVQRIHTPQMQLSIFDVHSQTFNEIRDLLNAIDINRLTPVEALLKLNEIKGKIQ